jgi:hypothetical protein
VLLERLRIEQRDHGAHWLLQRIDLDIGNQEQQ